MRDGFCSQPVPTADGSSVPTAIAADVGVIWYSSSPAGGVVDAECCWPRSQSFSCVSPRPPSSSWSEMNRLREVVPLILVSFADVCNRAAFGTETVLLGAAVQRQRAVKHLTRIRRRWFSSSGISSSGRGFAKTAMVAVLSVAVAACAKSVDFSSLERADRIEVRTPSDKQLKEINDRVQISTAIAFIKRHRSGWSESPFGPVVPDVMLHFYRGQERLGGFGIGRAATSGWFDRGSHRSAVRARVPGCDA